MFLNGANDLSTQYVPTYECIQLIHVDEIYGVHGRYERLGMGWEK